MTLRIVTLLARHGSTKYGAAVDELDRFYARRLPGVERELVVIDNALPETHRERLGVARTLIGGSNQAWEFSAWDCGISFVGERLLGFDFVHLVTSAYSQLYTRYIERFDETMLGTLQGRAAAVGHVDRYDRPVELFGRFSQSWLRTSFLFVPPTEIRVLGSLASVTDRAAFFSGDPADPFSQDAPLCAAYRAYIMGWLTGSGTGQGVTWHSRFDLTGASLPRFEAKTLAILNEHALTIRLRVQGCATVDATWLAAHVTGRPEARRSLGAIPRWFDQLAKRDVDAVPIDLK